MTRDTFQALTELAERDPVYLEGFAAACRVACSLIDTDRADQCLESFQEVIAVIQEYSCV